MTTETTFDLDAAIAAVRATDQAAHEARQRQEAAERAAEREREIATLRAAARESFGDGLIQQPHMSIRTNGTPRLSFGDGALIYLLWYNPQYSQKTPWKLSVEAAGDGGNAFYESRLKADDLHADLFRAIGDARYKHARMQQEAAANAEWEAAREVEHQERIAARAERLAAHERCEQRIAAAIAAAPRWVWPTGREITIYRWSWCIAAGAGESSAEYDGGYSRASHLGSAGQVTLEAERGNNRARVLVLDMLAHKPVVEQLIYRAVDELPRAARESFKIQVAGIAHDYSDRDPDGDPLLAERDGETLTVEAGEQPLAWIRELLDQ